MCDASGSGTSASFSAVAGPLSSVICIARMRRSTLAELLLEHPDRPRRRAQHSRPAISSIAAAKRDSSTGCTTITSRAWSPSPFCTTDLTDTPCSGEHLRDLGQHARLVGDLEVQVERGHDVADDLQHARSSAASRPAGSSR